MIMIIEEIKHHNSFKQLLSSNLLIYGFVLTDQTFYIDDILIGDVVMSIKEVEFENEYGLRNRSVIFTVPNTNEYELSIFLFESSIHSNANGLNTSNLYKLLKILRNLIKPNENDFLGLLGECLFIYHLIQINETPKISSWHLNLSSPFDFTLGDEIFEIKTTSGDVRKHSIKYIQPDLLLKDFRRKKYYVSIVISNHQPDYDIKSLIDQIRVNLNDEVSSIFNSIINKYDNRIIENGYKFNLSNTLNSIKIIDVESVGEIKINNDKIDFVNLNIPVFFDF